MNRKKFKKIIKETRELYQDCNIYNIGISELLNITCRYNEIENNEALSVDFDILFQDEVVIGVNKLGFKMDFMSQRFLKTFYNLLFSDEFLEGEKRNIVLNMIDLFELYIIDQKFYKRIK